MSNDYRGNMDISFKPARYTASLPPTPCTEEMKEQILNIAKTEAVSVAQVQRVAFAFFLKSFNHPISIGEEKEKA